MAIAAAPDYAIAYENLGDIYARLAAANYEKALARDARNKTAPAKLKLVREVLAAGACRVQVSPTDQANQETHDDVATGLSPLPRSRWRRP